MAHVSTYAGDFLKSSRRMLRKRTARSRGSLPPVSAAQYPLNFSTPASRPTAAAFAHES